mmetsp:Transcript_10453/g.22463  ORF Transcript_10453/g.22463 Transcript_10453/m.22463 type:complete len:229 (+) Transcript_10453:2-688(+)
MRKILASILAIALAAIESNAFSTSDPFLDATARTISSSSRLHLSPPHNDGHHPPKTPPPRRAFLFNLAVTTTATLPLLTSPIPARSAPIPNLPSVTLSEFELILKDSAKSVLSVELSGPKSETALVRLVDGTEFGISDLVESSVDPRSPLKLVAKCRLYNIPVRNATLADVGGVVGGSGKKKKVYMNERVAEAAEKEKEKKKRMEEDERERLAELYRLEGEEKGFLQE